MLAVVNYYMLLEFLFSVFSFILYPVHVFQVPRMLMLQYSKHGECILKEIGAAFRGEHPADLTIVCENKVKLHAHKLVLAAASPLIR